MMYDRINQFVSYCALAAAVSVSPLAFAQEDPAETCREAARLYEEDDIRGALEEAQWCVDTLKQLKMNITATLLPDEVNGFIGDEVEYENMLGMTMTTRRYTSNGKSVEISLTSGGLAAGGLAAIAQLGSSAGGGQKLRIQRQTVMDMGDGEWMVMFKGDAMMNVSADGLSQEETREFLEAFPLKKIADNIAD